MSKHKVLVADPIADAGIEELKSDPALDVDVRIGISENELLKDASIYEAIIVRSQTKITEDVINIYGYEDNLMCWAYWSMEYSCVSEGLIEIIGLDDDEFPQVSFAILDNGNLQIIDPEGELILLSPLEAMPDFVICDDNFFSEGCEDIYGQWEGESISIDGSSILTYLVIDESGIDVFSQNNNLDECYDYEYFIYDELEDMSSCSVFAYDKGSYYQVGQIGVNENEILSLVFDYEELDYSYLNLATSFIPAEFNPLDIEMCNEGCMDPSACNYEEEALLDDGSCEYGVECFVSPCSVSEEPGPGVLGAYCVDDYCLGCCAIWFYQDGTILSNSGNLGENGGVNDNIAAGIDIDSKLYKDSGVVFTKSVEPNSNVIADTVISLGETIVSGTNLTYTILDRSDNTSSYTNPTSPPNGISNVLVGGNHLIHNKTIITNQYPGTGILSSST